MVSVGTSTFVTGFVLPKFLYWTNYRSFRLKISKKIKYSLWPTIKSSLTVIEQYLISILYLIKYNARGVPKSYKSFTAGAIDPIDTVTL